MLLDLHNHSCLSPCGSLQLSPSTLVQQALRCGIQLLALTDHNTGENLPAFARCCRELGLGAVYGAEVSSREEVHVLCLFGELDLAVDFGRMIYQNLQSIPNIPEKLGDQVIVDAEENILGELDKHLSSGAVPYSLDELAEMVHGEGGLFIPAHVDRPAFSIQSQLGFLPQLERGDFDALEVMRRPCPLNASGRGKKNYCELTGSDAHFVENIGQRACDAPLVSPSFAALRDYLGDCFE